MPKSAFPLTAPTPAAHPHTSPVNPTPCAGHTLTRAYAHAALNAEPQMTQPDPAGVVWVQMQHTQAQLVATLCSLQKELQWSHDRLERLAEPHQAIEGAIHAVAAPHLEPPKSKRQAIAAFLATWTSPVLQILIGAAILVAGALIVEPGLMAMGAAYVVVGTGIMITLIASHCAPHPLDALKHYFERRHTPVEKPDLTTQILAD